MCEHAAAQPIYFPLHICTQASEHPSTETGAPYSFIYGFQSPPNIQELSCLSFFFLSAILECVPLLSVNPYFLPLNRWSPPFPSYGNIPHLALSSSGDLTDQCDSKQETMRTLQAGRVTRGTGHTPRFWHFIPRDFGWTLLLKTCICPESAEPSGRQHILYSSRGYACWDAAQISQDLGKDRAGQHWCPTVLANFV